MLKRSALAALVLASFASGALAQTQTQTQPAPQTNIPRIPGGPRPTLLHDRLSFQTRLWRKSMDTPYLNVTPVQLRRANKAAALINANHCDEAYKLAVAAQDDRLATGIVRTCTAPQPQ